jgi:hypothetical protein
MALGTLEYLSDPTNRALRMETVRGPFVGEN